MSTLQELPQNRLPAKRAVKLHFSRKIITKTGHSQFEIRLEIKTTINKHDKEISNKIKGLLEPARSMLWLKFLLISWSC